MFLMIRPRIRGSCGGMLQIRFEPEVQKATVLFFGVFVIFWVGGDGDVDEDKGRRGRQG